MLRLTSLISIGVFCLPVHLRAETPILIPKVERGGAGTRVGGSGMSYKEREERGKRRKIETVQGVVISPPNEFGHVKMSRRRGKDLYLSLLPEAPVVKDEVSSRSGLKTDAVILVAGQKRGYVGGLPKGATRRRILGANFILSLPEGPEAPDGEEREARNPSGTLKGKLISEEPLVMVDAKENHYELRLAGNCRVVAVGEGSWEDAKEGIELKAVGYSERVTLRPKGKTVARQVFHIQGLRILAPKLRSSDYTRLLKDL